MRDHSLRRVNHDELYTRILERFKSLESKSGFVLCVGTDYTGVSEALEFDVNVEVARNLGSPMVPIVNGLGKDRDALVNAVRAISEALEEKKCDILAFCVNRVEQIGREGLILALTKDFHGSAKPLFVIPEEPLLKRRTIREIARAINAELISGDDEWLDGEVRNVKIAAMELPNFLDYLEEGSLVITPGDRSDIILGTLAADRSSTYPRVAALVLTGNLKPAPQVQRLIEGLRSSPVPVMCVDRATRVHDIHERERYQAHPDG